MILSELSRVSGISSEVMQSYDTKESEKQYVNKKLYIELCFGIEKYLKAHHSCDLVRLGPEEFDEMPERAFRMMFHPSYSRQMVRYMY